MRGGGRRWCRYFARGFSLSSPGVAACSRPVREKRAPARPRGRGGGGCSPARGEAAFPRGRARKAGGALRGPARPPPLRSARAAAAAARREVRCPAVRSLQETQQESAGSRSGGPGLGRSRPGRSVRELIKIVWANVDRIRGRGVCFY